MNENDAKNLISSTIGYDSAPYSDYWKQQQAAAFFSYSPNQQSMYNYFYDASVPFSSLQNWSSVIPNTHLGYVKKMFFCLDIAY